MSESDVVIEGREVQVIPVNLPPYDHDALCPKCRFMTATTTYHRAAHRGCPIVGADVSAMIAAWPSTRTEPETEPIRAYPEHLDRACPNCKYVWAEAPL